MKKLTAIFLSLVMLLTLAACSSESNNTKENNTSTDAPTAEPIEEEEVSVSPDSPDADDASESLDEAEEEAENEADTETDSDNSEDSEESVGIANPFEDYATAEEAAAALGYDTELPEAIGSSDNVLYRVMNGVLLEVIYYEGETEIARIRKAEGAEDISGVNTLFTSEEEQEVEGRQVTFKGDGEKIQLAIWVEGAYTYSVYAEKGLELDAFTTAIAAIS